MSRDWMRDNYDVNQDLDTAAGDWDDAAAPLIDKIMDAAIDYDRQELLSMLEYALDRLTHGDLDEMARDYGMI